MKKISFFIVAVFLLISAPSQALTVLSLNLEQLSHFADDIFVGQVLAADDGWDQDGRPIVTVSLKVIEGIKGDLGATYQFKQLRAFRPGEKGFNEPTLIENMPQYPVGAQMVLFMSRPSKIGLTAPIGIFQGQFEISQDADGNSVVTNQVQNKNLFLKIKTSQTASLKSMSAVENHLMDNPSPGRLKTEDFLSIVRKLAK